jgi:hypothetical protein
MDQCLLLADDVFEFIEKFEHGPDGQSVRQHTEKFWLALPPASERL